MTRIKLCGITNLADMTAAVHAGADYIGFITFHVSPRRVSYDTVKTLMELLRGLDVERVPQCIGVFVEPDPTEVERFVVECKLQGAQIHRASAEVYAEIQRRLHGVCYPVIQPRTVQEALDALPTNALPAPPWIPHLLMDTYHKELAGGTGQTGNMEIARALQERLPRFMLAGGLTPENVGEVVRTVRPWAVDVSSGIEAAPGKKDHTKMAAFVAAVHTADATL
ncbi:MAG TPA: phosphoribosylanthranilate isomerase [Aggregatilineales bacterium]|nr:phosphoribosylanthranilate isomerase [Anaerolineales bacterium]HRE48253.1 phosphoribosylanthranilate isomerase [Aggregatilineales bacterium]